jgi:hypothetical protein
MRVLTVVLFIFSALLLPHGASATSIPQAELCEDGGGPQPWPWGYELDFPWNKVNGAYTVDNCESTFFVVNSHIYHARKGHPARRVVSLKQYDAKTCKLVAQGEGIEYHHVVSVVMKGEQSFVVGLHAFQGARGKEPELVMSLGLTDTPSDQSGVRLKKVREDWPCFCYDQP